jgi:hypothetical protein
MIIKKYFSPYLHRGVPTDSKCPNEARNYVLSQLREDVLDTLNYINKLRDLWDLE